MEYRFLSLSSGVEVPFRLIQPEDARALQRVHARCSERTIYLRFFGSLKELSEEKARYFASVDDVDHFGLVALDPEDPDEIIAMVRYDRQPGDERAEYAALVEDRWQGQGVGTNLTRRLVEAARDKGVRSFCALVKGENRRRSTSCGIWIFRNERFGRAASRAWRSDCTTKKPYDRGENKFKGLSENTAAG